MYYLALVSLLWAFSFGLIKGELTGLDSNLVSCLRLALTLPLFLPLLRIRKLEVTDMGLLALLGAIQYGFMYVLYIASFKYLEAYQVATLSVTTPLFVTLIADGFEKKFHPRNLLFAVIAIIGAGIIVFDKRALSAAILGIALMQLSNICFALGQVAYKRFRAKHTALKDSQIFGLLYLGAVALTIVTTTSMGGWTDLPHITMRQWLVLLYLGVLASGLCFFWWNKGAVKTPPGVLAVFNNVKIPLAVLVALLIFRESADLLKLAVGGSLIGLALWLAARKSS